MVKRFAGCTLLLLLSISLRAALRDEPFLQDVAVQIARSPELTGATFSKVRVDKDGVVYVLTDQGVARVFENRLALDRSFRPLAGKRARDITLGSDGELYYLFDDSWLSNGQSGVPLGHVPTNTFESFAVNNAGDVLLSGSTTAHLERSEKTGVSPQIQFKLGRVFSFGEAFYALESGTVRRIDPDGRVTTLFQGGATALARRGDELIVGTKEGYCRVDARTGAEIAPRETKLPVWEITGIVAASNGVWYGTTRGVFFHRAPTDSALSTPSRPHRLELPDGPRGIRYYASRRWLDQDHVLDLALDPEGHLWVLTTAGLNKIEFRPMTLEAKADYFDRKVRSRHIRFGLTGERRLPHAGDVSSSEIIDTDNDGGWSSYYLGSQALRYAVTRNPQARSNAWEVFAALERLQKIHPLLGFPARTIERAGFKFSDTDRWRQVPGGDWEWKGHTSSDEIASQTFAHAAMWECVAESEPERARIRRNYIAIVDHIIAHGWYLVDVDGHPTLWGRWSPEYVNRYPVTIFDRRLNSSEIIASLQLAHRMTGEPRYRAKADELFSGAGYLTNILSSMKLIGNTPGYVHQGNEMGDEWNHSDDELAFFTYWVLHRFAFDETLRAQYGTAIQEHWDIERAERSPIWNFIYAGCGGSTQCDADGALWTLRGFPLDTITWRIENSHRKDLTILPPNFMKREMAERLPPGEHQITRCNTQPFILDGGDGGHIEFPGDEFLLGYWLGRFLHRIE